MMKHADELVRTSNPVIRSPTRYPWTNALARNYIKTDVPITKIGILLHMAQYSRGYFHDASMLRQILVTTGTKLSDEMTKQAFYVNIFSIHEYYSTIQVVCPTLPIMKQRTISKLVKSIT